MGFSNVTAADLLVDSCVTVRLLILPQKEKKSRTSFSLVALEMPVTCTVVGLSDMFAGVLGRFDMLLVRKDVEIDLEKLQFKIWRQETLCRNYKWAEVFVLGEARTPLPNLCTSLCVAQDVFTMTNQQAEVLPQYLSRSSCCRNVV